MFLMLLTKTSVENIFILWKVAMIEIEKNLNISKLTLTPDFRQQKIEFFGCLNSLIG